LIYVLHQCRFFETQCKTYCRTRGHVADGEMIKN